MTSDVDSQLLDEVRRLVAAEPDLVHEARERAASLSPPSPEVGALLRWAVQTVGAAAAVEVGSGGGVSGWWLATALPERGVLTSIEADPHAHSLSTTALEGSPVRARVRSILGDPSTVLPRLSDGGYDLVLLQGSPAATTELIQHARRLLRIGGVLLIRGALQPGDDADGLADALQTIAEEPGFSTAILPIDDGFVLATRVDQPAS